MWMVSSVHFSLRALLLVLLVIQVLLAVISVVGVNRISVVVFCIHSFRVRVNQLSATV